jgi:hypothetical protein
MASTNGLTMTLSIITLSYYAEGRVLIIGMLNVIMPSVVKLVVVVPAGRVFKDLTH